MEAGAGRTIEMTASDDLFEADFHAWTQHQSAPSLEPKQAEAFAEAYEDARDLAASETGLPVATFPANPPFSWRRAVPIVTPTTRRRDIVLGCLR